MDEENLIKKISTGDEIALKDLFGSYSTKIYNTALGYTQNIEDAEEILQDVFLIIFKKASKFKFNSSVSTWIYRITINKSLDFLRQKNSIKRKGIIISIFRKDSNELIHEPVDFVHPGVKLENAENAKLLFKVVETLQENQKTVFILTQVEGLPQQEVADIMNTTRKSVESLLQRAKVNLRKSLEKYYPGRGNSI
ncbi:MAG: RNA polymerase sigma factor [Flammeovirgaceae bacterium]|nr:RNA polymerase sigma factor [Flammeovirgaceae bacterium]